ncbi:MAG: virB8 family protein [Phenylobacterium sp.]|jgi:type IV secretion system protein VirB8|uniref:virB8 family protein n=1 Tax=Phenylobacterium sp. TaxID=1871053 RepID=UPI0017E40D0B|nr:virB8 family protein [Phenylobacterium sp.]MBA4794655.1 virB8 family protein [Phenylobacterium sp.]
MSVKSDDLKVYFQEARSWNAERLKSAEASRRTAWRVAAAACGVTVACAGALAALSPLKRVEPYVVRVDRATGAVDVMTALKDERPLTYDEAVTKHFLAQYVRAREGWLAPAASADFEQVAIMSTPAEQQRWAALVDADAPESPQNLYGAQAQVEIEIRAISFINDQVAAVRFHRRVRRPGQMTLSDWVATVAFGYTRAPMSEADRLRNPLGFQVSSYRADPEVTP